jgi:hypothetical protein
MRRLAAFTASIQVLSVLGLATTGVASWQKPSQAQCVANPMDGVWQNVNPNTRSIVRVEYRSNCNDVVLCPNGQCPPPTQDIGKIRVFGACHPTACDWGWTPVSKSSQWSRGHYDQGFVDRWVWARLQSGQLKVVTRSHFKDNSGRADYETQDKFRKLYR